MQDCDLCGGAVGDGGDRCRACCVAVATAVGELTALTVPGGAVAAVTHRGLRRARNEDAFAMADGVTAGAPWAVLVICDGVSMSAQAGHAASIAARAACGALARFARGEAPRAHRGDTVAMGAAVCAAHEAICDAGLDPGDAEPPGTTLVAALVRRGRVVLGWAGDSRAYWITDEGAELLTRDHSWANEMVSLGTMTEDEAMQAPNAHAITRCLGPLEAAPDALVDPEVREHVLAVRGHLVLCTDGLWNYAPGAGEIAGLVRAARSSGTAADIARSLVRHALTSGGRDNVAVAVHLHEPS